MLASDAPLAPRSAISSAVAPQVALVPCIARDPFTIMCGMVVNGGRRTQLLRGVLDLCLLAVMDEGPAYGYEMTKRLGERGLSIVGEGSIYPLLGRLERDGLVDTHRAASNGGPPRKYYQLSRQGQRALASGVDEWQTTREAVDSVLGLAHAEVRS
jgi:PadR family transcriptional regulator PadR